MNFNLAATAAPSDANGYTRESGSGTLCFLKFTNCKLQCRHALCESHPSEPRTSSLGFFVTSDHRGRRLLKTFRLKVVNFSS